MGHIAGTAGTVGTVGIVGIAGTGRYPAGLADLCMTTFCL